MVNVGGRSRGCSSCRRRRVKCDETMPICLRCKKRNLKCEGVKDVTFIHHAAVGLERGAAAERNERVRNEGVLSSSLHSKGFETQIFISYAKKHLFRGGTIDLVLQSLDIHDIQAASSSHSSHLLLHRSILSLAVICFGHQNRIAWIRERGFVLYGITIQQLNSILAERGCEKRDDVLMSVVTLAMLEIFFPTGRKFYWKHMQGLERLLEMGGPRAFWRERRVMDGVRQMALFSSLEMKKSSILAREEWKDVVWGDELEEGVLFNVLVDITVLREEQERIKRLDLCKITRQDNSEKLVRQAKDVWNTLRGFKDASEYLEGSFFWHFPTSNIAILFHAASIFVLEILASYSTLDTHDIYNTEARKSAISICRIIPYFLSRKDDLDSGTSAMVLLAVRAAMSVFREKNTLARTCVMSLIRRREDRVSAKGIWTE